MLSNKGTLPHFRITLGTPLRLAGSDHARLAQIRWPVPLSAASPVSPALSGSGPVLGAPVSHRIQSYRPAGWQRGIAGRDGAPGRPPPSTINSLSVGRSAAAVDGTAPAARRPVYVLRAAGTDTTARSPAPQR